MLQPLLLAAADPTPLLQTCPDGVHSCVRAAAGAADSRWPEPQEIQPWRSDLCGLRPAIALHLRMDAGRGPRKMANTRQSAKNKTNRTNPPQHARARMNAPRMSNIADQVKQPVQASAGLFTLQLTLKMPCCTTPHVVHPPLHATINAASHLARAEPDMPHHTATVPHAAEKQNSHHKPQLYCSSHRQRASHCPQAVGAR
jgi:hypothetical protein